jgi:hypothetical protein
MFDFQFILKAATALSQAREEKCRATSFQGTSTALSRRLDFDMYSLAVVRAVHTGSGSADAAV